MNRQSSHTRAVRLGLWLLAFAITLQGAGEAPGTVAANSYVLGPEDQIRVWVLGLEEAFDKPVRIDPNGQVDLPLIGTTAAAGLTVDELRKQIARRLESQLRQPVVSVSVLEIGSQPVSVLGAVNNPGVHQLRGERSLAEVLSLAGGVRTDAGYVIKISRDLRQQPIPLPSAKADSSGRYSVAEVRLKQILDATNPDQNIRIQPHDVVTVPQAELVYVIGAVRKPGGFTLREQESLSVLHALSLAEGLGPTPAPRDSLILRTVAGTQERREIPVDLTKILSGKAPDVAMQANDVLLVPTSTGRKVAARMLEAIVQTSVGVAIWRR